jgi:hypothetical protein
MSGLFADLLRGTGSGSHLLYVDFTGRLDGKLLHGQHSRCRRGQWRKYYRNCQQCLRKQCRSNPGSIRNPNPFTTRSDKRQHDRMSGLFADLLRGAGSGSHLLHVDFTGRLDRKLLHGQHYRYRRS